MGTGAGMRLAALTAGVSLLGAQWHHHTALAGDAPPALLTLHRLSHLPQRWCLNPDSSCYLSLQWVQSFQITCRQAAQGGEGAGSLRAGGAAGKAEPPSARESRAGAALL